MRVILVGGVETESCCEDCSFEVLECKDVSQVARFWDGTALSILLVDFERLSEGEKSHLRKQMAQFSTVLVLAIADLIDDKECEELLRLGCVGSVKRRETPATLIRALSAVTAGELWFPRATLSRVLKGFLVAQDPDRLTTREREILDLVGADINNQQIADQLFIARETVRWHIKSLHSKLGIRTRRGLRDHVRLLHRLEKTTPVQREAESTAQRRAAS